MYVCAVGVSASLGIILFFCRNGDGSQSRQVLELLQNIHLRKAHDQRAHCLHCAFVLPCTAGGVETNPGVKFQREQEGAGGDRVGDRGDAGENARGCALEERLAMT